MRSILFVPGDSDRKLAKAPSSGADILVLDLEDAVALDAKQAAREMTAAYLAEQTDRETLPPLYVRINDLQTGLAEDDLDAVLPARPAGIMSDQLKRGIIIARDNLDLGIRFDWQRQIGEFAIKAHGNRFLG